MVRFNEQGSIDARNGIAYEADAAIAYAAGRTYHFRLTIDPTTHTYSVYVTPAGASEQTLATSYAFRTEQAAASSLANWGLIAEIGSLAVSNFTISGLVTVDAGANQTITLPAYAVVRGTVKVMGSSTLPAGTSLAWSKASGPGTVTFSSPSTLNTAAYFSTAGSYQLQLAASYVGKWFTDVTTVQVNAAPMSNGMTSTAIWQNTAFTAQGGSFTAGFDVIPNALGIDGITALSTSAIASYSTAAAIVRFNTGGTIDVRNGGTYAAVTSIAYTAGKSYHFRLVVNVPYHTYSVYVTPAGGTEQTLATNYGFRTEQASATSLANWGLVAETGSHTVSNFQLTAAPLVAEAGPAVTINAGAATVLNGSCSGGTAPYTYTWSPGTGLSSTTIASPTAAPSATTTYTLTGKDAAGKTATDTVVVTVTTATAAPLVAEAGPAVTINAGAATMLNGSCSGGTAPYTYTWSPGTGLSGTTIARPTAAPSATTTYTLTGKDAAGKTATDTVVVTVTTATSGPTYYVSPTGSDGNPGTAGSPWKTLAKAGASATPGSTVIVRAGTYNESFTPSVSGTSAAAMITFKSETPRAAQITGAAVSLSSVDYVRLEGFDILNTNSGPGLNSVHVQSYTQTGHGHGIQIVGNYIHAIGDNNKYAIWAANVTDLLIENNEMYNNGLNGVYVADCGGVDGRYTQNVIIRGNYIHHNLADGIHPEGVNILIENNRIGDQYGSPKHQDGIECYGPVDGMIIRNNLIWDTSQNIYLSGENPNAPIRNVQVLGNVVWNQNNPDGGKGLSIGGNLSPITNLRIDGNTFGYNVMNIISDSYAQSTSAYITGLTMRNNIFYVCGPSFTVRNPAVIDNNFMYNPGSGSTFNVGWSYVGYSSPAAIQAATGQRWFSFDPMFVNPNPSNLSTQLRDFRLLAGSPCIDKGVAVAGLTANPVGTDGTLGGPRPLGAALDLGAYEKQ